MKYAISFFGILVVVISGMLFFQFQAFSSNPDSGSDSFSYTQEIEIVYRDNSLDIRQHFKNLPNQSIIINWPILAINQDCFMDSENSCKRLNKEQTQFNQGDSHIQSLSYIIPLDGGLKSRQLLKDIFVTLSNGEVTYSTIHISTDSEIVGQWVTGLPLIGQQSLSLVNYAMFSGTGPVSEIYWQAGDFKLQKTINNVAFYSKKTITDEFSEQLNSLKFLNEQHIDIVQGENRTGEQGNRILFLNELSMESLQQKVILSQVKALYDFGESPQWLSEVVASYLSDSTIGGSKAAKIINTLTEEMTDSQRTHWVNELNSLKGKEISAVLLDETLSKVLGNHTQYFSSNESTDGIYPLLYNDIRDLYVNNHLKDDVNVIFKEGFIYYSADSLLKHLGYVTKVGENGYYVNNDIRVFRFPKDYGFYVYNQRRYNTGLEPIIEVAGEHYVEEEWLQRLFLVEVTKTSDEIQISPMTTILR